MSFRKWTDTEISKRHPINPGMDQLVVESHSINKSSTSSTPTTAKSKALPPPPPPAVESASTKRSRESAAKAAKKEADHEAKEQKKTEDQSEESDLRRKVTDYLENKRLKHLFAHIPLPGRNASHIEWQSAYEKILSAMKSSYKDQMVSVFFNQGTNVAESVLVSFLNKSEYMGLSTHLQSHRDLFEPELSELAIEMPNHYVPGPSIRLLIKLSEAITSYHAPLESK